MLNRRGAQLLHKKNQRLLRALLGFSYSIGVNFAAPSFLGNSLKIWNVTLVITNIVSIYGHWGIIERFSEDLPKVADSIGVLLQNNISMIKMIYCLFMQERFAKLLSKVKSHEMVRQIEILKWDTPILRHKLEQEITVVMESVWLNTRRQVIVYMIFCICIISNYIFGALFINLYHYLQETPNYTPVLPGSAFYPCWEGKGMSFPYYPLQMFIHTCSLYMSGVGAISFDGIFIVLCLHGIGLVRILKVMIKLSTSEYVPKNRRTEYLRCCIYHYQRTEKYLLEIQQLYKHVSLSQFVSSLLILGLVLFQASASLSNTAILIRMAMYICAAFSEVVIYCYNGQCLTDATNEFALAFYSCAWYDESKEFKELIKMMILRTNRNFHMDISWFTTMSLTTLLFIVKTSSSYFLLLRNVTE